MTGGVKSNSTNLIITEVKGPSPTIFRLISSRAYFATRPAKTGKKINAGKSIYGGRFRGASFSDTNCQDGSLVFGDGFDKKFTIRSMQLAKVKKAGK